MDWFETRLDDSLFESILSPIVRQALEQFFCPASTSRERSKTLSGFYIFHRELGLILQNDGSRSIFPKSFPGLSWEALFENVEGAIVPSFRPKFTTDCQKTIPSNQGVCPLQQERIADARSLFFWTSCFDWGRAVFLRAGGQDEIKEYHSSFKERESQVVSFLRPLLDRWIMDSTLEVFWCRILANMPSPFKPSEKGEAAPLWTRSVFIPVQSKDGKESELSLVGEYHHSPVEGWTRILKKPDLSSKKSRMHPLRAGPGEKGTSVEVPVDLWGLLPLGIVRFQSEIIRNYDIPNFLSKLRRARGIALRSLYRHLLYPGPLEALKFWIPEAECFDLEMLKAIPELTGDDKILEDGIMAISLLSAGYRKNIEEKLRPGDLLLQDSRKLGRLWLLLRNCPPEQVTKSVIPRILSIEGVGEQHLSGVLSLKEYMASQGITPILNESKGG